MTQKLINFIIKHNNFLLWAISIIGILLRVIFIIVWQRRAIVDSFSYIAQAEAIINGSPVHGFPNGYPLLIALIILIVGKNSLFAYLITINFFAAVLTGFLFYKIALKIGKSIYINYFTEKEVNITSQNFSRFFALLTLFLFAIYPTQILFTNMILTESITTFFIVFTVYLLLTKQFFTAGISLAITTIIRTTFLPTLLFFLVFLFYFERNKVKDFVIGAAFILLSAGVLDAVGLTQFPSNQKYNLLVAVSGASFEINFDVSKYTSYERNNPLKTYLSFAFKNPVKFTFQRISSFYELWGPYPFDSKNKLVKIIFGLRFWFFLSWIFTLFFVFKNDTQNDDKMLRMYLIIVSAFIVNLTFIHTLFFSNFRFVVPVEPLLIPVFLLIIVIYIKKRTKLIL
ncbi:MAG: hypothetical protein V1773_06385 [bacterium]